VTYVGLIIAVFVPEILRLMVTPKFYAAGEIIPLVVLSMIIFGCHFHFNFGILESKKTKYLAYTNVGSAVLQIGLNYFLIKEYGLKGGVLSAIVVLAIQAAMLYGISQKLYPIHYELKRVLGYLGMGILFYEISAHVLSGAVLIDVAIKVGLILSFPIIVTLLGFVSEEERKALGQIWRGKIRPRLAEKFAARVT
jgi:O-antigen/teichoic acid export membrane protein